MIILGTCLREQEMPHYCSSLPPCIHISDINPSGPGAFFGCCSLSTEFSSADVMGRLSSDRLSGCAVLDLMYYWYWASVASESSGEKVLARCSAERFGDKVCPSGLRPPASLTFFWWPCRHCPTYFLCPGSCKSPFNSTSVLYQSLMHTGASLWGTRLLPLVYELAPHFLFAFSFTELFSSGRRAAYSITKGLGSHSIYLFAGSLSSRLRR